MINMKPKFYNQNFLLVIKIDDFEYLTDYQIVIIE